MYIYNEECRMTAMLNSGKPIDPMKVNAPVLVILIVVNHSFNKFIKSVKFLISHSKPYNI